MRCKGAYIRNVVVDTIVDKHVKERQTTDMTYDAVK